MQKRRSTRPRSARLLALAILVVCAIGAGATAAPAPGLLGRVLKVGYLGCSQTTGSVQGYHSLGGARLWHTIEYGGGAINRWSAPNSTYWQRFDAAYRAHPALTIWWQLCVLAGGVEYNVSQARLVLAQIRLHAPGSVIYVSGQNGYVAPHRCNLGPPNAALIAETVATRLIAGGGGVLRGPKMSDLRGPDSAGPGPTETDAGGCHPNALGRTKLGANLRAFFG